MLHGENGSAILSAQARAFCAALRDAGTGTMCCAELANAHHAFDTVATVRSRLAADNVADFIGVVYGPYLRSRRRVLRKQVLPVGWISNSAVYQRISRGFALTSTLLA